MEAYLEKNNPSRDLGGLCECFVQESIGVRNAANLHIHPCFELLFCMQGGFEMTAGQQSCRLSPGDAVLIHPMAPHSTRSLEMGKSSYLVLKFLPESLYSTGQQMHGLKYLFPYLHFSDCCAYAYHARQLSGSGVPELLQEILRERQQQGYGYELALHAYICQVMLWFLRAWHCARGTGEMDERTLNRLQQAQRFIDSHIEDSLRQEEVAAHLGMGLSTFSRFFTKASGMSFPAYVRGKRLGRAAALLAQSDRSITEIAVETGFSSASYLVACFRKQYGVTPTCFRSLTKG